MKELELPPMLAENQDPKETAFTVTVDCNVDTTTGISAKDRAQTMRMLADPKSTPGQFTRCVRRFCTDVLFHLFISPVFPFLVPRPGHIFPLRAREGGVLVRDGHTEATMDFCRLAGLEPCGVLCEVVNDDGSMARVPDLLKFCEEHGLVLTSIANLIEYVEEHLKANTLEALGWSVSELEAVRLLENMKEAAGMQGTAPASAS